MTDALTVSYDVSFGKSQPQATGVHGRIPRVAKLMALAHRMAELVRTGAVSDYAELARLGKVTRARITQIMNLLLLAPDVQEGLLFLEPVEQGPDPLFLRQLQPLTAEADWNRQRTMWNALLSENAVQTAE